MLLRASGGASFSSLPVIGLLLVFNLRAAVIADKEFCPEKASVDLTNATRNATGFLTESGHFFPTEIVRKEKGALRGCMCDVKPCVPLCFRPRKKNSTETWEHEYFRNISEEMPQVYTTPSDAEDLSFEPGERFHFFVWDPCPKNIFTIPTLRPNSDKEKYYILKNGSFFLPFRKGDEVISDWKKYCLLKPGSNTTYHVAVCSNETYAPIYSFRFVNYGGIASIPFHIATIIIYSILPELRRNIHGKAFRCHLCCVVLGYTIFTIIWRSHANGDIPSSICYILGFALLFFFITRFLWLNVMCFNMWRRLTSYGSDRSCGKLDDHKKFICYSIYAWGVGTILTGFSVIMEFSSGLPKWIIRPGFEGSCWFQTNKSIALYFCLPSAISVTGSFFLFLLTLIRLIKHKIETKRHLESEDSKRHDENKQLFKLYLNLFVIMGVSWSFDGLVLIWPDSNFIWNLTETITGLQGFLIFVIFVCKKDVLKSLKKRCGCSSGFNCQKGSSTRRSTNSGTTVSSKVDEPTLCTNDSIPLDQLGNTSHPELNDPLQSHVKLH